MTVTRHNIFSVLGNQPAKIVLISIDYCKTYSRFWLIDETYSDKRKHTLKKEKPNNTSYFKK